MKGYKGYNKGLICRGKQYAENTVFEEEKAEICNSGMHFCENPFDVLDYYGFIDDNREFNEFTEVEALDEVKTDDNKKFCTTKLKVGAKLGIVGLVNAFVEFTLKKCDFKNAKSTNTGDYSASTNTGNCSASTNTGNYSASTNTGYRSASTVEGKESFAIATGIKSKARGKKGCYIAVAEWQETSNGYKLKDFKAIQVDGEIIKENTFYQLKNGEFVEVE